MSTDALFQLGMDLEAHQDSSEFFVAGPRSTTQTEEKNIATNAPVCASEPLDHFIEVDGVRCAGSHIIVDLYDAERLNDIDYIEQTLHECITAAGATLLHIHLHPFQPTGVSGVAVLAESHISVHTWPEAGYAAFDVFMCGDAQPLKAVEVLKRAFKPSRTGVNEMLRGTEVV